MATLLHTACAEPGEGREEERGGEKGKERKEEKGGEKRKEKERRGEGRRRGREGKRGRGGEEGEGEEGGEKKVDTLKDLKVHSCKVHSCNVHLTGSESVCKTASICPLVHTWTVSLKCRIFPWDSALTWNTALLNSSLCCSHLSNDASNLITWEEEGEVTRVASKHEVQT